MIAQVSITDDGDVTATVDSDDYTAADDEASRLAGLVLDDMLARAAQTAIDTWFRLRSDDGTAE